MKAKEYIEKYFDESDEKESLFKIVHALFVEVEVIAKKRNAQLNSALVSIFKEQDKKWEAVLNKLNLPKYKKAFIKYAHYTLPELKELI